MRVGGVEGDQAAEGRAQLDALLDLPVGAGPTLTRAKALLGAGGYLSLFPGTYVGLSYGMNDAASPNRCATAFTTNRKVAMLSAVVSASA